MSTDDDSHRPLRRRATSDPSLLWLFLLFGFLVLVTGGGRRAMTGSPLFDLDPASLGRLILVEGGLVFGAWVWWRR